MDSTRLEDHLVGGWVAGADGGTVPGGGERPAAGVGDGSADPPPARALLGSTTFTEADLDDAAAREVAAVTGLSLHRASTWIADADGLCGSMPGVVTALAAGRLDRIRATTVAQECSG